MMGKNKAKDDTVRSLRARIKELEGLVQRREDTYRREKAAHERAREARGEALLERDKWKVKEEKALASLKISCEVNDLRREEFRAAHEVLDALGALTTKDRGAIATLAYRIASLARRQ